MKILFVGAGEYPIYETAFFKAAKQLGYQECELFRWKGYFKDRTKIGKLRNRAQLKFSFGYDVYRFAADLCDRCRDEQPDIVFLYSCRILPWRAVKRIAAFGIYVASYCNDDPFTDFHRPYFWRNWRKAAKFCNVNYVYRKKNLSEVERISDAPARLILPYYIKQDNYPCGKSERIRETPDVIFLGHLEDDERIEYLRALTQEGITVGLNKSEFGFLGNGNERVVFLEKPRKNYNRYLCSCKIPIVFLSKINHDTYTRRCFEIPAAGAFLFCPYTDDLARMFEEGREIVFYRSKADFIDKVRYYLEHDLEREKIAAEGRKRLLRDGHEVTDRVREIMDDYYRERVRNL